MLYVASSRCAENNHQYRKIVRDGYTAPPLNAASFAPSLPVRAAIEAKSSNAPATYTSHGEGES